MSEAFTQAMGRPDPAVPNGLSFTGFLERVWELNADKVGTGFFRDRFLYLFGEGLEVLRPCLDAWSFLIPPMPNRMIVGRNAYGAIAYVDNPNDTNTRLYIVDPLTVELVTDHGLDLWRFIARDLPQDLLGHFLDDSVYRQFVAKNQLGLELDLALAIKEPLTLGGAMELDNFAVEDIVGYYQSTAPIYAKGMDEIKKSAAKKRPRKKKPE